MMVVSCELAEENRERKEREDTNWWELNYSDRTERRNVSGKV